MIYMDNSATTFPKPFPVREEIARAFSVYGANPGRSGYAMSMDTAEMVYACRQKMADIFSVKEPEFVILQPNCTQALNTVIKGVLKKGDHVVISDLEHNAVVRPLEGMKKKGVSYTVAKTFETELEKTISSFEKAIKRNTKLIICTHASNVFGIRLPIEKIAKMAHSKGVKICVDCAQTGGVLPIYVEEGGIDFLCGAGHKGLYGPMGTGFLIMRKRELLDTLIEGGTGTDSISIVQPNEIPERYESGTQNIPGIIGLKEGIRFVENKGVENIYKEEMELISYLYEELEKMNNIKLYTKEPKKPHFVPVLSFNVEGIHSEDIGDILAHKEIAVRCGLHCAPFAHKKKGTLETGTVRVSPSVFTTLKDIDTLIQEIKAIDLK